MVTESGVTWQQIGQMTKYQFLIAAGAKCPEDGRLKLSKDEAAEYMRQKQRRQNGV